MLIGRARERQALDEALARARAGTSAVVAVVGEPGIGKTALLDEVAAHAGGLRVLRARGVESEAQVPFGGLLELLRPALGLLERLPQPQAAALGGALALRPGGARDRFAVGAGTLGLLAAAAEESPLLVLVEDVQWLDGASAEALLFALRRLLGEPIAVVLSARDGEPSLLDGADLPTLRLAGLELDEAAALVARAGTSGSGSGLERLHRATGGNPLALLELGADAAALAADASAAPLALTETLVRAFGGRVRALPDATRRVLLLAAAEGGDELAPLARAAAAAGVDVEALAAAEAAGVVTVDDGRLAFRHPLMRSAAYAAASAPERRAAHRALADVLPDRDADRRAWHLAAAALGPDAAASAALAEAGARATERGAHRVATAAYERAARLAVDDGRRAALLFAAGEAAWLGGLAERAESLLVAAGLDADEGLSLAIDHLRGHVAVRRGQVADGLALLVDASERAAGRDPALAVVMLAEAAYAGYYAADVPPMLRAARRASELAPAAEGDEAGYLAALTEGMALVLAGLGREGPEALHRGVDLLLQSSTRPRPSLLPWVASGPIWLRESAGGRDLVDRALEQARAETALGVLPFLLVPIARDHAMGDAWLVAESQFHEGIGLARESGQATELAMLVAGLAGLRARQGREAECRALAGEARALSATLGAGMHDVWALGALGLLELGLGRAAAAVEALEELDRLLRQRGVGDPDLWPAPELVDAYVRLGRRDDAVRVAAAFAEQAEAKGQPWALACAARCSLLLGGDDELDERAARSLALHEQTPDVFAAAVTRLAYGARLRRARRRSDAREPLRQALGAFERLGAEPWAEAARTELVATGETARRRDPSNRDLLTPQELQIALLLAGGRTTREAAAALFLSPKTIEWHLGHVYDKLGVRTRSELAAAMAGEG